MPQLIDNMKIIVLNKIYCNTKNNRFKSGTHHIQTVRYSKTEQYDKN